MTDDTITKLNFSENGINYAKFCVDITVYWRGSVFDKADSVIRLYKRSLDEVGSKLKFFRTGSMSRAKKLRSDSLEMVPYWFGDLKRRREDIYMVSLEAGEHADEPSDHAIRIEADEEEEVPLGMAQLCLPVEYVSERPERLLNLFKELTDGADFESGHAGYSLNWNHLGNQAFEAKQKMGWIAGRYLGVDLFRHDVTMCAMQNTTPSGIKCVNWLTLLGTSLMERVGGVPKLESKLSSGCEVHALSNGGTIIRAGEHPTPGDRRDQAALAPYRGVGKVLAPFRFMDHKEFFGSPDNPNSDQTRRWLARFDG